MRGVFCRISSATINILKYALNPNAIAVIGASQDTNKTGGRALDYLQRFGFAGRILPVNPNASVLQGLPVYASPAALPVVPDLAIIALPARSVVEAVRGCAERGVKVVVVTSSGFAELGDSGKALESEMLTIGHSFGMRIIGPNSQGIANFSNAVVASFSSLFLEVTPADGPVAVISQSGSMSVVPYCQLRELGVGVRYCVATGNQVDLDVGDFALAAIEDPDIHLVLLYFESLRRSAALIEAAHKANARGVPIVAALSHTGAIATEDRIVDAFLARQGIWRAEDGDALVRASEVYLRGWRPRGRRLVVLTDSGATAVMMADSATRLGLELASFSSTTISKLKEILPAYASVANPVDMTSVLRTESHLFGRVLDVVVREDVGDLFVIGFPASGAGYDVAGLAQMTAECFAERALPVAMAVPQTGIAAHFREVGIPTFSSETDALKALYQLAAHSALMQRKPVSHSIASAVPTPPGDAQFLSEAQGLKFLCEQGFPVVPHEVCDSLKSVRDAAQKLGSSVVLKGSSCAIQHKSEQGLVHLDLGDDKRLTEAFEMTTAVMTKMGVESDGVIVASMINHRWEIMIGARVDAVFGAIVLVGEGGGYVEVNESFVTLAVPFTYEEMLSAIHTLPRALMWLGMRGEAGADLEAVAELACGLGRLITRTSGIASIDLNPVLAGNPGEGVLIADVLVERSCFDPC